MANGAAATNAFCAACTFIINALRLQATTTSSIQSKNNMEATKGTESVNKETGTADIKVETVDYRSPPGDNAPTLKENVEIIHQTVDEEGGPGAIRKGLAAVGRAAESAKDAITSSHTEEAMKHSKPQIFTLSSMMPVSFLSTGAKKNAALQPFSNLQSGSPS